jgi:hypothetical protein
VADVLRKLPKAKGYLWYENGYTSYTEEYNSDPKQIQPLHIEQPFKRRKDTALSSIKNVHSAIEETVKTLGKKSLGSPGKFYRTSALEHLVPAYSRIFSRRATSTPSGEFVLFCE